MSRKKSKKTSIYGLFLSKCTPTGLSVVPISKPVIPTAIPISASLFQNVNSDQFSTGFHGNRSYRWWAVFEAIPVFQSLTWSSGGAMNDICFTKFSLFMCTLNISIIKVCRRILFKRSNITVHVRSILLVHPPRFFSFLCIKPTRYIYFLI
jgi:hypothetical protein